MAKRLFGWLSIPLCLVAGVAAAGETPTTSPETVGMSSERLAKVDAAMNKLIADKKLAGGVVMIARRGNIVHFQSYGMGDIERRKPMQNDTIVRIYSMTKAITTAAALMLVEEGKIGLDDPASKYLPEMKGCKVQGKDGPYAPAREMTVRDLMLHTSGLSYGSSSNEAADKAFRDAKVLDPNTTLADMTRKLGRIPLVFEPGSDWLYGVSIDVLGRIVEVVSGQPLDEFFQQRIFTPLHMNDTGFFVPAVKKDRFAVNYKSDGKGTLTVLDSATASPYLQRPKLLSGGGGLASTARDYMRFLLTIAGGGKLGDVRLLSEKTVGLMTSNQLSKRVGWIKFGKEIRKGVGFGLGFCVRAEMSDWDPRGRVGEYGWGGAASTHYWTSPKDDLSVVILEQTMPYSFLTEFALKGLIYDSIIDGK